MARVYALVQNNEGKDISIDTTVKELVERWHNDIDIPTNNDEIVGGTLFVDEVQLYCKTFGELMSVLTGEFIQKG